MNLDVLIFSLTRLRDFFFFFYFMNFLLHCYQNVFSIIFSINSISI